MAIAATVLAIVAMVPAFAKGPSQAVIEGPGLARPIEIGAPSSPTIGQDLASMIKDSGFFVGLACRRCASRSADPPAAVLGPRYTVTYTMALEGGPSSPLTHDVYPYAEPGPVTYMPPGQPYWGTKTTGGWVMARPGLRRLLIDVGLPPTAEGATNAARAQAPPTRSSGRSLSFLVWMVLGIAVLGIAALVLRRQRTHP